MVMLEQIMVILSALLFGAMLMAVVIRYAIDRSQTSRKIGALLEEVSQLRRELKEQEKRTRAFTVDKKV